MAPSDEDDFPSIGNKCFEICKLLGNQGLAFKFKLTFGTFCFSLDTMEIRTSPAPGPVKKKKSQSAVNRDKRRRIEFLQRKAAASSQGASLSVLDISSSGPGNPSPVDIQGASAAQRNTQDINQTSDTSGLKIRMEKSGAGDWSISPSLSRRNSVSSKADPVPDGKENVKKAPKVKKPLPCRNCHQPFLQNHQCDDYFDFDDDDQFGDSDDDDDELKAFRSNLAFKCICSLHFAESNDSSPQSKKPRNSWRQLKYPDHCLMKLLLDGKIEIPRKTQ